MAGFFEYLQGKSNWRYAKSKVVTFEESIWKFDMKKMEELSNRCSCVNKCWFVISISSLILLWLQFVANSCYNQLSHKNCFLEEATSTHGKKGEFTIKTKWKFYLWRCLEQISILWEFRSCAMILNGKSI